MADGSWTAAAAKARFGEVIDKARSSGPQHVTKNGRDAVVVLAAEDYAALKQGSESPRPADKRSLHDVLFDPSIRLLSDEEHDEVFARSKDLPRPIKL